MEALTALTGKEYRQDVISGGLRDYIINGTVFRQIKVYH